MVLIGGIGTAWGPVFGAFLLTFLPEGLRISQAYYQLIYGAGIIALIIFLPMGLFGLFQRRSARADVHAVREPSTALSSVKPSGVTPTVMTPAAVPNEVPDAVLVAQGLTIRFGGLIAVDALDLSVQRGTIHGLIGPNGSGKSTFINLVSAVYKPTAGSILFDGHAIEGARPWQIANAGLVRTFQNSTAVQIADRSRQRPSGCPSRVSGWMGRRPSRYTAGRRRGVGIGSVRGRGASIRWPLRFALCARKQAST